MLKLLEAPKDGGAVTNLAPYIPGFLHVKGRPMRLDNHLPFEPLYSTRMPNQFVIQGGRQLGKSYSVCGRLLLQSALEIGYSSLVVTPLQVQSDRLSSLTFTPMIEDSPIRALLMPPGGGIGNVRRRDFPLTRGAIHFLYAFLSADRVRSLTANLLWVDEFQDLDGEHLPVLTACLDAVDDPVIIYSGTSKTLDTALRKTYEASSMGVWCVKCEACGYTNRAVLEPEGDLIAMIDTRPRDDISEKRPGTVCRKCRTPINPRYGRWVHRAPERMADLTGIHVPQVIMPLHACRPAKWRRLVGKMNQAEGFTTARFYNEVLGEPYDVAVKLLSEPEIRAAAVLGPRTAPEAQIRAVASRYRFVALGVDWGGGGGDGTSRTKVAAAGFNNDGVVDIFYGAEFPPSTDPAAEAEQVVRIAGFTNATIIAHDANGSGRTAESILVNNGRWRADRLAPMYYQAVAGGDMITYRPPDAMKSRPFYTVHKHVTLQFFCAAVRAGKVRFFADDYTDTYRPGLLRDFLALVVDHIDSPGGAKVYRVRRADTAKSDDFAHAANFAALTCWKMHSAFPDVGRGIGLTGPPDSGPHGPSGGA